MSPNLFENESGWMPNAWSRPEGDLSAIVVRHRDINFEYTVRS